MGPGTQTEDDSYVGMKGLASASFEVFAVRGDGQPFAVKQDTVLHPSDRIRFVVVPAGAKFVMVASTDGAGVFSVYHPFGAAQSQPVDGKYKIELPGAVELDGKYADTRVLFAETYAVKAGDTELFKKLLDETLALPDDVYPDLVPETKNSKRKAKKLLGDVGDLF